MKKKFKKKRKSTWQDKRFCDTFFNACCETARQAKRSLRIKGRERRKKTSQRAKIFGRENKRRINQEKEIVRKSVLLYFCISYFFLQVNVPKNKKRDLLLNYRMSDTLRGVWNKIMESLILAQNERWRRVLSMQVERQERSLLLS